MTIPIKSDFKNLNNSEWDAVVVGAGPAGAIAAREMARLGASVLLVDKAEFPRYKVCGCCLNGRAQSVLSSVELGGLTGGLGAIPLNRFELASGGIKARLPLPRGVALSRTALDKGLADAAAAHGATFTSETRATLLQGSPDSWRLELHRSDECVEVSARVVLAADGLGQKLLRDVTDFDSQAAPTAYIGAGAMLDSGSHEYSPGTIYMAHSAIGYVGLVRVEDGSLNIAAALDPSAVREHSGLGSLCAEIIQDAGFPTPQGVEHGNWRGTPPLTRSASRLSAHRVLVLGDAAGYVEPFTGEGMAWALSSGRAAAAIAYSALDSFDEDVERAWACKHRDITGKARRRCQLIASALRRPRLVQLTTRILHRVPALASPVIRGLNSTSTIEREVQ